MKRVGRRTLGVALLGALGVTTVGRPASAGLTRSRIFLPPTVPLSLKGLAAGARFLDVATGDGLRLRGIAVEGRPDKPVLLVFHGNASSAADVVRWFAPLIDAGYGVVAAEYRGYSGLAGAPSEIGLRADAEAFHAAASSLATSRRLIVIGHSLGGGAAFGLARTHRLDALVTVGTFSSMTAMAPRIARAFIADRFDNLAVVPTLDEPLFIVHGTADQVVPVGQGNLLHNRAIETGRRGASFVVAGAGHQPAGTVILSVVDAVAAQLDGRATTIDPIISMYPFGNPHP